MADATDLKSVLAKARYGFESHHRHSAKCASQRANYVLSICLAAANGSAGNRIKVQSIGQVSVKRPNMVRATPRMPAEWVCLHGSINTAVSAVVSHYGPPVASGALAIIGAAP